MNYETVPNIISTKDLDYLSDMFNWNYGIYKNLSNMIDSISDIEIKGEVEKIRDTSHGIILRVLNIIGGTNG